MDLWVNWLVFYFVYNKNSYLIIVIYNRYNNDVILKFWIMYRWEVDVNKLIGYFFWWVVYVKLNIS